MEGGVGRRGAVCPTGWGRLTRLTAGAAIDMALNSPGMEARQQEGCMRKEEGEGRREREEGLA